MRGTTVLLVLILLTLFSINAKMSDMSDRLLVIHAQLESRGVAK